MPALSLLFFFVIERGVLVVLVIYNKVMFEKVAIQRTQPFLNFSLSKEPQRTQLNEAHAQLLEKLKLSAFAGTHRFQMILGSITSRCSGKEPALLARTRGRVDQTRESGGN